MKKRLLACAILIASTNSQAAQERLALTVTITGVPANQGALVVGLVQTEQQFMGEAVEYRLLRLPAKLGKNQVLFPLVPSGKYAIFSYHDKNNNHELDENWRGIPQEAFGFSGAQQQLLEAPKFQELLIDVLPGKQEIQVNLIQMD